MGAVGLDQIQRDVVAVVEAHALAPAVAQTRVQIAGGAVLEEAAAASPQHQVLHHPRFAADHQLRRPAGLLRHLRRHPVLFHLARLHIDRLGRHISHHQLN